MQERTIICDGASKTWAMTGWRLGFVANRALAPTFTRWITNTESCASQISQWAAVEAIDGPQDAVEEMQARFLERRDLIVRLLNDGPGRHAAAAGRRVLRVAERDRGLPRVGAADSEAFRKRLLNEAGIAVLADIHFGRRVPGDGQHLRFSYAASTQAIEQRHRVGSTISCARIPCSGAVGIDDNQLAREAVLARVRAALGREGPDDEARAAAHAYLAARVHGPRPSLPDDLVQHFQKRATDMASTVERIASLDEVPAAVARYLNARGAGRTPAARTVTPVREQADVADAARLDAVGIAVADGDDEAQRGGDLCVGRVLARIRRTGLDGRGTCDRGAPHGRAGCTRHHRVLVRDRRDGHARVRDGRGYAVRDVPVARDARGDRPRVANRRGDGRGVCARARRRRDAAGGEPGSRDLHARATSSRRSCSARTGRATCTSCSSPKKMGSEPQYSARACARCYSSDPIFLSVRELANDRLDRRGIGEERSTHVGSKCFPRWDLRNSRPSSGCHARL